MFSEFSIFYQQNEMKIENKKNKFREKLFKLLLTQIKI